MAELRPVNENSQGPSRPKPGEGISQRPDVSIEIHRASDVDFDITSQHHTLGPGRTQASPGSHNHDGTVSKKLGAGLGLTLTGSKGGNVALTNLINMLKSVIEFTDSTT